MSRIVLQGGDVMDGAGSPAACADVVIETGAGGAGTIVDVGTDLDGDEALDCSGATITPGFVDAHVHLIVSTVDVMERITKPFSYQFFIAAQNLAATLRGGVTAVRDAAGTDAGVRQAVDDGLIDGPRLKVAIQIISQTGGQGDGHLLSGVCVPLTPPHPGRPESVVDGRDQARKTVREILRAGADVIKIATSGGVLSPGTDPATYHFSPEEISVIVGEATAQGRGVMAHAHGAEGVKNAVRAGVRSIEHGALLDDEAIDLMVSHGTVLVPTLMATRGVLESVRGGATVAPAVAAKAEDISARHTDSVTRAIAAGVPIAMGTDSGVMPHGRNLEELPLMAACGMSPEAVVAASTSAGADLLGIGDTTGVIEPGKNADVCVIDGSLSGPGGLDGLRGRLRHVFHDGRAVSLA